MKELYTNLKGNRTIFFFSFTLNVEWTIRDRDEGSEFDYSSRFVFDTSCHYCDSILQNVENVFGCLIRLLHCLYEIGEPKSFWHAGIGEKTLLISKMEKKMSEIQVILLSWNGLMIILNVNVTKVRTFSIYPVFEFWQWIWGRKYWNWSKMA